MRILHITSALVGGGAETQLKLLMRGLADRGHEVGVVFLYDDPDFKERDGIKCFQIERGTKLDFSGLCSRIAAAINEFAPDVVHTWLPEIMTSPAVLHCRRSGIPCLSAQRRSLRESLPLKDRVQGKSNKHQMFGKWWRSYYQNLHVLLIPFFAPFLLYGIYTAFRDPRYNGYFFAFMLVLTAVVLISLQDRHKLLFIVFYPVFIGGLKLRFGIGLRCS